MEACQSLVGEKHRKDHCSSLSVAEGKSGTNGAAEWRNEGEMIKTGVKHGRYEAGLVHPRGSKNQPFLSFEVLWVLGSGKRLASDVSLAGSRG